MQKIQFRFFYDSEHMITEQFNACERKHMNTQQFPVHKHMNIWTLRSLMLVNMNTEHWKVYC